MERFGVSTALLTPFTSDGSIDRATLGAHARDVLSRGANSVTLFGTTGEGASIARSERADGIAALLSAGCQPDQIVLGICATAVADTVDQVEEGMHHGIRDFLLLPPFYFKGNGDQGLYDWHMQVLDRTDPQARFILYHIPQVTGVGLTVDLVGRLAAAAPGRLIAIKDSSGDWDNAKALLDQGALQVLVGDERVLHKAMALGAGGAITGMANLYPERMKRLVETATEDPALSAEVTRIVSVPVIPALKAIMASRKDRPDWENLRAPLMALDDEGRARIFHAAQQVA